PGRRCLEVGCGTGSVLGLLSGRFEAVVGVDLAMGMLRRADCQGASLIQGDAGKLPFADSSFDLIVAVNAFLFPAEYKRVLAPRGSLIFVSTNGDRTPIYLSPERVAEALGEEFAGVSAESGNGVWSCFSRHAFWEE
ncbi:MAG: class I SAM-dependent methyltransferase, partial [Actinomycetota bacterium]|nr:class I SAM-dependent methyltransferase [Actinomycetota bacterium]